MIFQYFCFVICLVKKWKFGLKVENCSTFCIFWKFCEFFLWFLKILFEFFWILWVLFIFFWILWVFNNFFCIFALFSTRKINTCNVSWKLIVGCCLKKNKKVRSDSVIRFGWKYRKNLLFDVVLCLKGNFTLLLSDNTILREFQCCLRKNKTKICLWYVTNNENKIKIKGKRNKVKINGNENKVFLVVSLEMSFFWVFLFLFFNFFDNFCDIYVIFLFGHRFS